MLYQKKRNQLKHRPFSNFWTHLGPILVELIVEHIIQPQCCKSRIWEDLTDIVIIGLTITLKYQENVGPRNKRGCFQHPPILLNYDNCQQIMTLLLNSLI